MKLLKKLLPLGIVAATASAVVPMAVSCGTNEEEFNGITDLNFKPDKKREGIPYQSAEMGLIEYASKVSNDNNILVQDYYWTVAQTVLAEKEYIESMAGFKDDDVTFSVEAKNMSLKTIASYGGSTLGLLSGDIKSEICVEYNLSSDDEDIHRVLTDRLSISLKDIPVAAYWVSEDIPSPNKWSISFAATGIWSVAVLNSWVTTYKLSGDISSEQTETIKTGDDIDETHEESKRSVYMDRNNIEDVGGLSYLNTRVMFSPYYLIDCTVGN